MKRLLVANRGEIACRIIEGARRLGLEIVAIEEAEASGERHSRLADDCIRIASRGGGIAFLDVDAVIEAARSSGADSIHPGYGFLSENPLFAQACEQAGIVFVGPSAQAMRELGNKSTAKLLAESLGIPCLAVADPGRSAQSEPHAGGSDPGDKAADAPFPPILLKAAAGGGGRGMRVVRVRAGFEEALRAARAEALSAFGSDEILIEPFVAGARHVEIQLLADRHGTVLALGERDCSTQRRHQKIIEESPAPGLPDATRKAMSDAAIALAREARYVGAGTVEFLLAPDGRFWFLEVNTRLQVEHPVTEACTGIDLVEWQLRIARGEPLSIGAGRTGGSHGAVGSDAAVDAGSLRFEGHAIEVRLCAEDPGNDFLPDSGHVLHAELPIGLPGIRVDHGLTVPGIVSGRYDSLLAKIIAHGPDRVACIGRLRDALRRTRVFGIATNRDLLLRLIDEPAFANPQGLETRWLDHLLEDPARANAAPAAMARWQAAALGLFAMRAGERHGSIAGWCSAAPVSRPWRLKVGNKVTRWQATPVDDGWRIDGNASDGATSCVIGPDGFPAGTPFGGHCFEGLLPDSASLAAGIDHAGWLDLDGICRRFEVLAPYESMGASGSTREGGNGVIAASMHAVVRELRAAVGDRVRAGQTLVSIEAMKMVHPIPAAIDGTIERIDCRVGDQVRPGQPLLLVTPEATVDSTAAAQRV